jgi:hypothetical protein
MRLNDEGVAGHMSAVPATDADSLVNPDSFFGEGTAQYGFHPCGLLILL